ncbi:Cullin-associated Nedd8-dissociated protein 1 [Toxocara canis]|uniref:Cullin-associated Nedd8-dissociated protein 1 n=1 Tax=Toxocara canis TaxID=6265 RepID=A0A0B2UR62_TOXCA|nr:Cullin-associated Nedd8-dissociated protein 1 [Toxocara canis]
MSFGDLQKLHPHMSVLVPLIVRAVGDSFYKVSAEALTVTLSLIRVLRPSHPSACMLDFTPFVSAIYEAVAEKLKATDIDQVNIFNFSLIVIKFLIKRSPSNLTRGCRPIFY